MKSKRVMTTEVDHRMTTEEIFDYYYKKYDTNLGYVMLFNDVIVVRDLKYSDSSKPGFALVYNIADNAIICTKIDNAWQPNS